MNYSSVLAAFHLALSVFLLPQNAQAKVKKPSVPFLSQEWQRDPVPVDPQEPPVVREIREHMAVRDQSNRENAQLRQDNNFYQHWIDGHSAQPMSFDRETQNASLRNQIATNTYLIDRNLGISALVTGMMQTDFEQPGVDIYCTRPQAPRSAAPLCELYDNWRLAKLGGSAAVATDGKPMPAAAFPRDMLPFFGLDHH